MRTVTPGIRFFQCTDCGTNWESQSRDCQSPSGEFCPNSCESGSYGAMISPYQYEKKPELPTDNLGNLISQRIRY